MSFAAHKKFMEEFKVLLEEFIRVGLVDLVGFHKLKKLLTFKGKFNETVAKEFYANISKNIGNAGNPIR